MQSVQKKDISTDIFTCNLAYGSTKGHDFGFIGCLESPVTLITWNPGQTNFGRMVVQKKDGTCITIGEPEIPERRCSWHFAEDERILEIKLYAMEDALSCIYMRTNRKTWEVQVNNHDASKAQCKSIKVGSEMWVGVFGNADVWLESLGFAMVNKEYDPRDHSRQSGQKGRK